MKHFLSAITAVLCVASFLASCSSTETYAEKVEKEKNAIDSWISNHGIEVIEFEQFKAQGYTTPNNQYVLLSSSGVYLHIVNKGTDGSPLAQGKSASVVSRYTEINVNTSSVISYNNDMGFATVPDCFTVRNYYGTFTGSFTSGVMYAYYGASMPGAWLVPLKYINLGRGSNTMQKDAYGNVLLDENGDMKPGASAQVEVICPHDEGTSTASSNVYATYYNITYETDD